MHEAPYRLEFQHEECNTLHALAHGNESASAVLALTIYPALRITTKRLAWRAKRNNLALNMATKQSAIPVE
jgi:hypothetical protein